MSWLPRFACGVAVFLLSVPALNGLGLTGSGTQLTVANNSEASSFTWETGEYGFSLDPPVAFCEQTAYIDCYVLPNVYESLLWYEGNVSDRVVPWLAENYTISPDGTSIQFTLRSGIRFADGNPLNSTSVYFSLNRLFMLSVNRLVHDGYLRTYFCCGLLQNYTENWADTVLAQGVVTINGPLTFQVKLPEPDASLIYLLAAPVSGIIDPQLVMSKDLELWNGQHLLIPHKALVGTLKEKITQYLEDEGAACRFANAALGCQASYLNAPSEVSPAGTGPYVISNATADLTHIVLSARPDYWGGPDQYAGGEKIVPHFNTVYANRVPVVSDRLQDLREAAASGAAMSVDINNDQLYDVANRTTWLIDGKLTSVIQNVSLYGPFLIPMTEADIIPFVMNVTNPSTGKFYPFQPFADSRLRLAFADAVDIGQINRDYNNMLGEEAPNFFFPESAPHGSYNASILPAYVFSPTKVQELLIDAMEKPLTNFRFFNGTIAPPGVFNNTFGCRVLNALNRCEKPVEQRITLAFRMNDTRLGRETINGWVISSIANEINAVSAKFNMGLQVDPVPKNLTDMLDLGQSWKLYGYEAHVGEFTPWIGGEIAEFGPIDPSCTIGCNLDGWNSTHMNSLYDSFLAASSQNNVSAVVSIGNQIMESINMNALFLWTTYPYSFVAATSNVQGLSFNHSILGIRFASLGYAQTSHTSSLIAQLISYGPLLTLLVIGGASISLIGLFATRRSRRGQAVQGTTETLQPRTPKISPQVESVGRPFNVQIIANVPNEVEVGQPFKFRADLVNTGTNPAALHKVEGLVPAGISVERPDVGSGNLSIEDFQADKTILLRGKTLRPSEIQSIQFVGRTAKEGKVEFVLTVSYSDESGNLFTSSSKASLSVRPSMEFEFKTYRTKLVFDFLVSAFIHDYMERKYPVDKAGWRSLVEISQTTRIPLPTLYGREGGIGPNLQELTGRGLVESRIFPGERGRGGQIMRMRVAYERDPIKEFIGRRVRIKK